MLRVFATISLLAIGHAAAFALVAVDVLGELLTEGNG
jgi:hypothetical protein